MYIRQECLFPLDELIKFQPETKHEMALSQLDFSNVVLSLSRSEYKRGSFAPPERLNERLHPISSMGYELVYWSKDGDYLKFRCPHVLGKVDCPHGSSWCSNSNYGYCLKINYKKNIRYFIFPIRSSDEWQEIYNLRTSIERCNSQLKDYLNTDNLRSAGIKKAKTFALLNFIMLVAGTIAVNVNKSLLKVA